MAAAIGLLAITAEADGLLPAGAAILLEYIR
jgi:hypothetical protein